jgi:hypothetical protein
MNGPGPFSIEDAGKQTIEAQPVQGSKELVEADTFRVRHRDGWSLHLAVPTFSDGQRDIRCLEYSEGTPLPLHRLTHGLRMSLLDTETGEAFAEMSQAKVKRMEPPYHSNLCKADEHELDVGAGCSVRSFVEPLGAEFGPREEVLKDRGRRRGYCCVKMNRNDFEPALAAYVLTRVLPLNKLHEELGG